MASHTSFVVSGLLLVIMTIVVQSIPIDTSKETVQSPTGKAKPAIIQHLIKPADSSVSSPTTVSPSSSSKEGTIDNKKKRYIDDEQLNAFFGLESDETDSDQIPSYKFDDQIEHTLHAKVKESSATLHDNADKPVDTDDSEVFSDSKMTPNELTDIVRRRRSVKLTDDSNRRRKRALSPYDFYDTDAFYNPYARPARSFAPLYWYPTNYERSIRSALAPSYYELSDQPTLYSGALDSDEVDEDPLSLYDDEDDDFDDENNYELNRYPILLPASDSPFDNLQLQQQYNTDDLPSDEDFEGISNGDDDDDEEQQEYNSIYQRERPSYSLWTDRGLFPLETNEEKKMTYG